MQREASAHQIRRTRVIAGATVLLIAVAGPSTPHAQAPTPTATIASVKPETGGIEAEPHVVRLYVGRSAVINAGAPITRVSLTSPTVADALVTGPAQMLVHGKLPGTISMFVWYRSGEIRRYEVTVLRDIATLADEVARLFPGEGIAVEGNGKDVVLSGKVSSKDMADKAISLATGFVEKKDDVVNLMVVQPAPPSSQVLLRVRFAEVSRSALTQLGAGYFTGPGGYKGEGNMGMGSTQQFPMPVYDEFNKGNAAPGDGPNKQTFSDFLNLFFFNHTYNIGTVIKALSQKGLFQSLAEPNLVAESGKEASFLAGGEIPIPIAQGGATGLAITIQYKEFGIRLGFTPVVTGDRIHLKLRPEVSSLDFTNGIVIQGFRIPALTTRRTETELELANGQTFAIAGLLNHNMSSTLRKVPGIGDIPVLGLLFQSKAAQKDQTELVVMITPEILPLASSGVTPNLPRLQEPYLPQLPNERTLPSPPPAFRGRGAGAAIPAQDSQADAQPSAPSQTDAEQPMTAEQRKQAEKQRQMEAERAKQEHAKAEADQKQHEKLAREQAKKDAEAAKRDAELKKKQQEAEKQRQKEIADAEAKLKAAQAAYEAQIGKKNDKDQ